MNVLLIAKRNHAMDFRAQIPPVVKEYITMLEQEISILQTRIDKQTSDEGWRQSALWAERSGGTL